MSALDDILGGLADIAGPDPVTLPAPADPYGGILTTGPIASTETSGSGSLLHDIFDIGKTAINVIFGGNSTGTTYTPVQSTQAGLGLQPSYMTPLLIVGAVVGVYFLTKKR